MQCPKCKSSSLQVVDSRDFDSRSIRRRRECESCRFRFTTFERVEKIGVLVLKRSGKNEPFDREKIIKGIEIASDGRISDEQIQSIADEVEKKVIESVEPSFSSKKIGNMVITKLKKIDEISYLRFASVYKNFQDLDSFEQELIKLKK